jgi:hypothetical protein
MNWIIRNLTGLQSDWEYKLTAMGNTGFHILSEGNKDQNVGFDLINQHKENIKSLLVGYEDDFSYYTMFRNDTKYNGPHSLGKFTEFNYQYKSRVCLIRDFFNTLSSRIKANENEMFKVFDSNKPMLFDTEEYFINLWKEHAKSCLDNKISYLKFEDLLENKKVREDFLWENYGVKDIFGIEGVKGTKSSFEDRKDVNERYNKVEISEKTKQLIRQDIELRELIEEMGYEYKTEILL